MSYRIEFLEETTEEDSVCHAFMAHAKNLRAAEEEAMALERSARKFGATGFQIRHLNAVDKIVAIGNFEDE